MTKLLAAVIAAMFAAVSVNAVAASHAGAPKDDSKMAKKAKTEKSGDKKPKAKKEAKGDKAMEKKDPAKK